MKRISFTTVALFICLSGLSSYAQFDKFRGFQKGMQSVDLLLGQPTLIRYNYFQDWKRAFAFDIGYHFDEWYYVGADYNFYFYNTRDRLRKQSNFFNSLLFYAGPGIFLGPEPDAEKKDDELKIGLKAGLGVEYLFHKSPFSLKLELAPAFLLKGEDDFIFQGMVGFAYYFGFPKKRIINRAEPLKVNSPDDDKEFQEFD